MKFCSNCGNSVESTAKYCNKCGNFVEDNASKNHDSYCQSTAIHPVNNQVYQNEPANFYSSSSNINNGSEKKFILIGVGIGILLLIIIGPFILKNSQEKYHFNTNTYNNNDEESQPVSSSSTKQGKYSTVIIYDNQYSGVKISGNDSAIQLIEKDSVDQKKNCPADIVKIENQIISNYGIAAVNLCEMDLDFAQELEKVFHKIYNEYPGVRGHITNLTLVNATLSEGYIAAFMPAFNFATADSITTYPWVIKTQVLLNTSYFLNPQRLEASVNNGSSSGHFPPNATIYSPVAHELGHYLSFLAMMKHYNLESILLVDNNNINTFYNLYSDFGKGDYSLSIINEAYAKYKKDTNTTQTLDEWRGTISQYALAKDNSGDYIYDETIAESFHDVYLNGNNAKDASKYIVDVLKEKLKS